MEHLAKPVAESKETTSVSISATVDGLDTVTFDSTTIEKVKTFLEKELNVSVPASELKSFDKAAKLLGSEWIRELLNKTPEELKNIISTAHMSIADAKKEVEETPAYVEAADTIKTFKSSLRETTAGWKMTVKLATEIIQLKKE